MHNITRRAALAFRGGDKFTLGNTAVTHDRSSGITQMRLNGNLIAERDTNGLRVTLAGWNTPTTRERVNGLLEMFDINKGYCQKDFEPYYNGELVSADDWIKVER